MSTRRTFLTTGLAASAASAFTSSPTHAAPATLAGANSVHTSFAQILIGHARAQSRNSKHNPFASRELSTAFRMHCDALQASGTNAAMTAALKASPTLPTLTATDIEGHYATLAQLGITFPKPMRQYITQHLTEGTGALAPKVGTVLESHSILSVQRVAHAQMLFTQRTVAAQRHRTNATLAQPIAHPRYETAVYHPKTAHLQLAEYCETCGGIDDGGSWGADEFGPDPGGWGGWNETGYSGGGESGPPVYVYDPYNFGIATYLDGTTVTTPSGAEIQICSVLLALIALFGSLAAAIAIITETAGIVIVIAGVTLTGPVLLATIGILAAAAGYYALVC